MKILTGIEISERYLKLAVAKLKGNNPELADCLLSEVLPSSSPDDQIIRLILDASRKWKSKSKSSVLCLPRNSVTVRNLHLPSGDEREILQMINLHIGRIVPYKKEEIIFGYQILGKDEMGYTKLILAIVHNSAVRRQVKLLEKANFFIDKISLSSYGAFQRAVNSYRRELSPPELYLLLDVDYNFTDFIIFSVEALVFSRSINVGADSIKNNKDMEVTKLLGEIRQSLITFYNEEVNKKPSKIFLGGARLALDLSRTIESELGIPVSIVSWDNRDILGVDSNTRADNVSFLGVSELTLGSSDKRINFLLPEIQIRKSLKERTRDLIILGTCAIYSLAIIFIIFLSQIYLKQSYLKQLNRRIQTVEKDIGEPIRQLGKIEFIRDYLVDRNLPLFIIYSLQRITPKEIRLNFLESDKEKITLRAEAPELSDVFKFVTTLAQTKYFKDVQTRYTRKKKIREREFTDFELVFQLRVD